MDRRRRKKGREREKTREKWKCGETMDVEGKRRVNGAEKERGRGRKFSGQSIPI